MSAVLLSVFDLEYGVSVVAVRIGGSEMSMRDAIKDWYEGEFVPYENDPNDAVIFIGGTYERHWTAKVARVLARFWLNHWQWTIGTALGIIGLAIAVTHK